MWKKAFVSVLLSSLFACLSNLKVSHHQMCSYIWSCLKFTNAHIPCENDLHTLRKRAVDSQDKYRYWFIEHNFDAAMVTWFIIQAKKTLIWKMLCKHFSTFSLIWLNFYGKSKFYVSSFEDWFWSDSPAFVKVEMLQKHRHVSAPLQDHLHKCILSM